MFRLIIGLAAVAVAVVVISVAAADHRPSGNVDRHVAQTWFMSWRAAVLPCISAVKPVSRMLDAGLHEPVATAMAQVVPSAHRLEHVCAIGATHIEEMLSSRAYEAALRDRRITTLMHLSHTVALDMQSVGRNLVLAAQTNDPSYLNANTRIMMATRDPINTLTNDVNAFASSY